MVPGKEEMGPSEDCGLLTLVVEVVARTKELQSELHALDDLVDSGVVGQIVMILGDEVVELDPASDSEPEQSP